MPPPQWPPTLTRDEFDEGCKALLSKCREESDGNDVLRVRDVWKGWQWKEHARYAGFGYLSRTVSTTSASPPGVQSPGEENWDDLDEIPSDPAGLLPTAQEASPNIIVAEHVVWSPTFRVPVFYFMVYDDSGSPLPLDRILHTSLFHFNVHLPTLGIQEGSASLAQTGAAEHVASVPLLTQGEHPTTGERCWYLHPCDTSGAVTELLEAGEAIGSDNLGLRWIQAWFLVVGTVVNLRA